MKATDMKLGQEVVCIEQCEACQPAPPHKRLHRDMIHRDFTET